MKKKTLSVLASFIIFGLSGVNLYAQAPLPPPSNPMGTPQGNPAWMPPQGPGPVILNPSQQNPNPNMPAPPPGNYPMPSPNPGAPTTPPPPPGWAAPGILANPPAPGSMNQGTLNVMATGYDSEGVLQQIPLYISYYFNGVKYNVTVLNAWNPYTQMWNSDLDIPANTTSYFINGFTYNYYAVLPIGTFYFNL